MVERRRKVGAKKGERVRARWEDIGGRGGRRGGGGGDMATSSFGLGVRVMATGPLPVSVSPFIYRHHRVALPVFNCSQL